jgi:hypothetical protein
MKTADVLKDNILDHIRSVGENSKNCKLSAAFYDKYCISIDRISVYFGTTPFQSVFIANVILRNLSEKPARFLDTADYLKYPPTRLLEYLHDINDLVGRNIITKIKNDNPDTPLSLPTFSSYYMRQGVMDAVLQSKPLPVQSDSQCKDSLDLLQKLYEFGLERKNEVITTDELFQKSISLFKNHRKLPLVKESLKLKLSHENLYFLCYVLWKYLNGNSTIDLEIALPAIFDSVRRQVDFRTELSLSIHPLRNSGFIELEKSWFGGDASIVLQDKALDLLGSDLLILNQKRKSKGNIILSQDIKLKQLFFATPLIDQLSQIRCSLSESNFSKITARMVQKGLPTGITILFYGDPGTGKTESVFQIARSTKREIIQVDLSQSKSSLFGESEKKARKIFLDYYAYSQRCKLSPILLINEADGLFSKRKDVVKFMADQTENTIQNIFLEELEKFKGILIATTNMPGNLDRAFDRRFLYKVKFIQPDPEVRFHIWASKLKGLTDQDYQYLAEHFNFSGGQIDNIVRKLEIDQILNGNQQAITRIIAYCNEETIGKSTYTKIGFRA